MVPARFLRAAGFAACLTGLSVLLFLATSRYYALSTANAVQAAQELEESSQSDQVIATSGQVSQSKPSPILIPRQEAPELDIPLFAVPPSNPSPAKGIASSISTMNRRRISPSSPMESGNIVTRLVIPDLRLDAQIRYIPFDRNTWDLNSLGQSVAWLENVAGGETTKNLVLAGHVTVRDGTHGPFRYLSRLKPGAKVVVYTEKYIYTYRVRELLIVKPEDAYLMGDSPHSQLTLLTCTTWNEKTKSYLRRQIVIADLLKFEAYPQGMMD